MPRRTTRRSLAQSVALIIALLLFALATAIAVWGLSHGSGVRASDAAGSATGTDRHSSSA